MVIPHYDPGECFSAFLIFYKKQLLFYDTMLYSIQFTSFFLIIYSLFLVEVMFLSKLSLTILIILVLIDLLLLAVYLAFSLKKVFNFSWIGTILRLLLAFMISFSVYQLIHYSISFNSGR